MKNPTTNVFERIELVVGDITTQNVDAIVNAANESLAGGGGVDGAIHRAAGPELLQESLALGGCPTGSAKITGGYNLPARFVIHAVGPVYRGGQRGEADKLASCYRRSLELAAEYECEIVAFSAISCGVFGYPVEETARIAIATAADFLSASARPATVRWVLFTKSIHQQFEAALRALRQAH